MENIINTASRQIIRLVCFPVCLFVFASLTPTGTLLAATSGDDMVSLPLANALDDADMGANRGGTINTTTVTATQTMNSTSTGNALIVGGDLTNGQISVGNNFGGSGIGSFVMNTGNNSVINSGVSLSVLMLK